jgi:catechol 2,3-dioxygenase-like lactoylglutathione lyase family enzyme
MPNHESVVFTHVGVCVRDLESSTMFYKDILGAKDFFTGSYKGEGISRLVGVKNADYRTVLLRLEGTMIELISYGSDSVDHTPPKHNQIGATHIAFQVADLDALYTRLLAAGIAPNSPPHTLTAADHVDPILLGSKFMIFRDPDGLQIETFQLNF